MLDTYAEAARTVWAWIKMFFAAVYVMLPSVLLVVYMFATWETDLPGIVADGVLAVNLFWAPIPLYRWFGGNSKSFGDFYQVFLVGLGLAVISIPVVVLYIVGCLFPVFGGIIYCYFADYQPSALQAVLATGVTVLWAPGANHLLMKLLYHVFGSHGGT